MVRVARVDRAHEAEATHPKIPGVPPTTLLYADKCSNLRTAFGSCAAVYGVTLD